MSETAYTNNDSNGIEKLKENRDSLERLAESDLPVNDIAQALLEVVDEES